MPPSSASSAQALYSLPDSNQNTCSSGKLEKSPQPITTPQEAPAEHRIQGPPSSSCIAPWLNDTGIGAQISGICIALVPEGSLQRSRAQQSRRMIRATSCILTQ